MHSLDDTIAAVSTPIGEGGIGIVRMTGPGALPILHRLFRRAGPGNARPLQPFRLYYGHVVDPASGDAVDEVLVVHMTAPRTYTRQDVVEIDAHGGIVAVQRVLALCLAHGARLAEPGEFTLRAFLNGRLDLAQAEAVVDVVGARTGQALQTALGQLAGHLSRQLQPLRDRLLAVLAAIEASIDFEEDGPGVGSDIAADLAEASAGLEAILAGAGRGIIYRQGVRAAIVGRPNVGKSSLLNCLLRTSRAIVTDIPGTTRDTLEETINLRGVPVILIDTAGIAEPGDAIERMGVERSREALVQADLALVVLDASEPAGDADLAIAALVGDRPAIAVLNKIDLLPGGTLPEAPWLVANGWPAVAVSALSGAGIDALEAAIVASVLSGQVSASDVPLVSNPRHEAALRRAIGQVQDARSTCQAGLPADLVAVDLAAAVHTLGEITGQTAGEELLDMIFSTFCIGK